MTVHIIKKMFANEIRDLFSERLIFIILWYSMMIREFHHWNLTQRSGARARPLHERVTFSSSAHALALLERVPIRTQFVDI